ncbi:pyridoxal phosphate-dependent aminotransferase [Ancylothrix sp. C2]|uniref:pyridoxal phosphate-dependent aminotransferase n=1 Tax=Ancylothrix sp. D3o TaxID=2953691 RepID=UPI0021BB6144|nr:pyridoxal phosphate-dependent aminotransferase [Ancylothrix sp. D3o]MCT7949120.1 pyridoxal phosphate-dependent aminotransferase [Ancylothrix sp. D3o]
MNPTPQRMQAVQSPIIPIVGEMIRNSPGTISLGQGVVYYGPPAQSLNKISEFFNDPENHKYKPVQGITPLLQAIEIKLKTDNHIQIDKQNCILVTAGSNMAFMNAILAITSPGDEIIIQTPYYFNHEMAIVMASCRPVLVETNQNYQLQPQAIEQAITNKTRAIVTISPNNPTGAVYSPESLQKINEICRNRGIYHISDEAYEYFTYNNVKHFSPASLPDSNNHTISLYSLSKAYGFASWRIGYMVMPKHLLDSVKKIQDTILICPPVISQYAATGALEAGGEYCRSQIQQIAEVRNLMLEELDTLKEFCTIPPAEGAFYFLLNLQSKIKSLELVEKLIREYGVAVIPGDTFGIEKGCYLRVAYGSLQKETAQEGIRRLMRGLKTIVKN